MRWLIGAGLVVLAVGCSSGGASVDNALEQDTIAADTSGASFQKMLDDAAGRELKQTDMDVLTKAMIRPTLSTEKLKMADAFVDHGLTGKKSTFDAYQRGGTQIQVLYWAMPRDLSGFEGSGQSFVERVKLDPENDGDDPSPFTIFVNGTAQKAYTLTLTIAETTLKVDIPAGAEGPAAAKLIAAAITKRSDDIAASAQFKIIKDFGDFDDLLGVKAVGVKGKNIINIRPDFDA
jgi:hypothetical protein